MPYEIAVEYCASFQAELPLITDDITRQDAFKWAAYNNYPYLMFWVDENSVSRSSDPGANVTEGPVFKAHEIAKNSGEIFPWNSYSRS